MCKQLGSANWKERLEAVEEITKVFSGLLPNQQALFSILQYRWPCKSKINHSVELIEINHTVELIEINHTVESITL